MTCADCASRKEAGLFCGSFLRKGELFAYVGSIQILKDLKALLEKEKRIRSAEHTHFMVSRWLLSCVCHNPISIQKGRIDCSKSRSRPKPSPRKNLVCEFGVMTHKGCVVSRQVSLAAKNPQRE